MDYINANIEMWVMVSIVATWPIVFALGCYFYYRSVKNGKPVIDLLLCSFTWPLLAYLGIGAGMLLLVASPFGAIWWLLHRAGKKASLLSAE